MGRKKKICIAYLGNPRYDTRITNLKESLEQNNCEVKVIGFEWLDPNFKTFRDSDVSILKLTKGKVSFLFYVRFKILLLIELFKTEADIYFAEDIYTLPFVKFRNLFVKGKIYYNSRELYAFLGGLRNRKYLQKFMTALESFFIKKVDLVLTTGKMDAEFLERFYGISNTLVIRNIPKLKTPSEVINLHTKLNLDRCAKILLYQGVLIDGRGIEIIIKQLNHIHNSVLVVLGDGERKSRWQNLAEKMGVIDRVYFLGYLSQSELINYTSAADLGLCLIENISISYYHALPNKLFEYIMAGVPVISSALPQMKQIVEDYEIGECIDLDKTSDIHTPINNLFLDESRMKKYKENCEKAVKELNWDAEFEKVKQKLIG